MRWPDGRRSLKRQMNGLLWLAVAIILASCASAGRTAPAANEDASAKLMEVLEARSQCISAWQGMIVDWSAATGGVPGSLEEIRARTRDDHRSTLSRIIQRVWRKQADGGRSDWMSLLTQLDESIGEVLVDASLPEDCASFSWLQPLLVETPGVFADGAREKLLAAAPAGVREESQIFSTWLLYGLLTEEP